MQTGYWNRICCVNLAISGATCILFNAPKVIKIFRHRKNIPDTLPKRCELGCSGRLRICTFNI